MAGHTILEYFPEQEGNRCGYCTSSNTSFSHGFWAHTMTVEDYQGLIDRGWRRSGKYCYKPIMEITCCPMYTIRCAVEEYKLSKSQKKILKRFNHFMFSGEVAASHKQEAKNTDVIPCLDVADIKRLPSEAGESMVMTQVDCSKLPSREIVGEAVESVKLAHTADVLPDVQPNLVKGTQLRPSKAKYLRIERKKDRLRKQGLSDEEIMTRMLSRKKLPVVKTLEDFTEQQLPVKPAHQLEVRLVQSSPASSEFEHTYDVSFELYKKYQISIHKDPPTKLTPSQYKRFLVHSPLQVSLVSVNSVEFERSFMASALLFAKYQKAVHGESDDDCSVAVYTEFLVDSPFEAKEGYGSYHQQYWLDGKLIAVGVIDILPYCVSSVYFYYDPALSNLSLGTYGALREVAFTRSLSNKRAFPSLKYYYMGFYIHSCVKMRYKATLSPSFLLCPEVYTWHAINTCLPKLDNAKYSRLNEDVAATDGDSNCSLSDVIVLYNKTAMPFSSYAKRKRSGNAEHAVILEYMRLVGGVCAKRMLLYRS